ncbi:hypothetical protein [Methanosarcina barkeri]|uniref:hypothetical protein n=1 Tax=Methanosarcina barkeri TaxID=2208 RepID=UPI000AC488CC|nr:hypothetical protein [Methanosarcina barkeri]
MKRKISDFLFSKKYEKDEIKFAKDEESEEKPFFYIIKYPVELASLGKKIFISAPKINISYLRNRFLKKTKKSKLLRIRYLKNFIWNRMVIPELL